MCSKLPSCLKVQWFMIIQQGCAVLIHLLQLSVLLSLLEEKEGIWLGMIPTRACFDWLVPAFVYRWVEAVTMLTPLKTCTFTVQVLMFKLKRGQLNFFVGPADSLRVFLGLPLYAFFFSFRRFLMCRHFTGRWACPRRYHTHWGALRPPGNAKR